VDRLHDYFYCVDEDFGPFFIKFCSYFPYTGKLCINGHEYLNGQLARGGIEFEALDNGLLRCADPAAAQRIEWFPGGKLNSSQAERLVHMSAAKDALIDIRADILCLQEVRDWDSIAELVSILSNFQTLIVSRFREMGSSGPLSIQQTAIASNRPAEVAWSSLSNRLPQRRREAFPLLQSAMARPFSLSIACILRAT
jgi:hypothetical protein